MRSLTFLALLVPSFSAAQDFLDPLVLTATRTETRLDDVPFTTTRIDSDFIRNNTRRTLPETLRFVPGVLVQQTTYGHGSPFIRGFTGRQNLILVDGVRLNNSTWRSGPVQYWNTVDSYAIDHLELVKSQGSVLYGSDAVGGTLNTFSKSSSFMEQPDGAVFSHGSVFYQYLTNGEGSQVGRVESTFGVGGKYGIHLGLTGKEFGDIESKAIGRMKNTGYSERDADFRFDMSLSRGVTLTLASQHVDQDDIWRWHRTVYNPGWIDGNHVAAPGSFLSNIYDQERSLTYLKVEGVNPEEGAMMKRWQATLSWQKTQDSESQLRTARDARNAGIDLDTYGLDLGFASDLGPGELVYGLDYYVDDVNSTASRNGVFRAADRPVADDSSYHLFGTYAQYEWRAAAPFEVTAGARFTHAEAEWDAYRAQGSTIDQGGQGNWDKLTGSLRGIYTFDDCWKMYGGLSQAFRAPNLNDLTGNSLALAGLDSRGSPDLDPENYLTAELGARYGTDDVSFNLAGFHTWTRDAITGLVVGTDSFSVNGEDGYIYGFEAEGAWRFQPDWTLSGMASWQEGKTDTRARGEVWMTRLLPLTGSLALRWTRPDQKLWVEARVLGATSEGRISAVDQAADNQRIPTGGTPGYVTAMLHAGYRPSEHLELVCGLENVTDEDYRIHGSGQNQPGFNGIFGVKLMW